MPKFLLSRVNYPEFKNKFKTNKIITFLFNLFCRSHFSPFLKVFFKQGTTQTALFEPSGNSRISFCLILKILKYFDKLNEKKVDQSEEWILEELEIPLDTNEKYSIVFEGTTRGDETGSILGIIKVAIISKFKKNHYIRSFL